MKNLTNNNPTHSNDVVGSRKIINGPEISSFQQENNIEHYNKSLYPDIDGIIEDDSILSSSTECVGTTVATSFKNDNNSNNNNMKEFNESVKKAIERYKLDSNSEPLLSPNFDDRFSTNNNCDDAEWILKRNSRWDFEEDYDYFHDSTIVSLRKPLNNIRIDSDDCDYVTRKRKRENDDNLS